LHQQKHGNFRVQAGKREAYLTGLRNFFLSSEAGSGTLVPLSFEQPAPAPQERPRQRPNPPRWIPSSSSRRFSPSPACGTPRGDFKMEIEHKRLHKEYSRFRKTVPHHSISAYARGGRIEGTLTQGELFKNGRGGRVEAYRGNGRISRRTRPGKSSFAAPQAWS